ncbi:hypothetical protein AK830_g9984 [Neonectria ditissima]|uniref:Transcription factor domain-containing protein n=1 Tax=Neonectria ditissima TaxID=78410 RepID=A0A0P7BBA4_9HYPO|nr:hypothetical protein AK830_g9984 [Neonectria ditissima]
MASAIPIVLCGKTEQIGKGVIAGLQPEYEVVHFILSPEAGAKELPQILRGTTPEEKSSDIGSGNLAQGVKAIVLGGAFDDEGMALMKEAATQVAKVPWLRQDSEKPAPPLGPEYGKAMVRRVKETLGELQGSGKLDNGEERERSQNAPENDRYAPTANDWGSSVYTARLSLIPVRLDITGRLMEALEGKLDQLIQNLSPPSATCRPTAPYRQPGTPQSQVIADEPWTDQNQTMPTFSVDTITSDQTLLEAGQLYLTWCHNQPIALFKEEGFSNTLKDRDGEVVLAIKALSLRFPPGSMSSQAKYGLEEMAKTSRRLVLDRIADGHVRLSTLQTLCLLSQIDFVDGNVVQSGLNASIASHLIHSLPPRTSLGDVTEFHFCAQAITMLQNLQGSLVPSPGSWNTAMLAQNQKYSAMHAGRTTAQHGLESTMPIDLTVRGQTGSGILAYAAEITDAWRMARAYAASHVGSDEPPPWSPESDYSSVMLRHLEVDCKVPLKYRFSGNDFGSHDLETLQQQRSYWSPWLFLQFIYAAIPCLLNHPFLLSMRLRNFRYTMPQSFIQQSFDQITRHAGWVIYFLDQLEKKDFQVSDPSLGHRVAIVATIHLQHSFVKDCTLRDKAQAGFETCMRFLQRMGLVWPSVAILTRNLRKLQESIAFVPLPRPESAETDEHQQSWSIDAQLLWDILIYERAGRDGAAKDVSIFDDALTTGSDGQKQDVAEFDLVGSAGIFGHKTAPKRVPVYAPGDEASPAEASNPDDRRGLAEMSISAEDRVLDRFSGLNDQDGLFLQANDFGRAIDNWFNFDLV